MQVQRRGSRGFLFTFDDNITVYMVAGTRHSVLCDTHLGPESMKEIQEYLSLNRLSSQVIIFNSHSDWDHIWGNCAFPDSFIIGHETCRLRMLERGALDLSMNQSQVRGCVRLVPPDLTFSHRLILEDEETEFSHAPGHTIDSSVCYDRSDNILYLGDLVEDPIPYLDFHNLGVYIETLQMILDHRADILVSAHSGIVTRALVMNNMQYIAAVRNVPHQIHPVFDGYNRVHQWNLNMRIIHRYEPAFRQVMGDVYSSVFILKQAGDLHDITCEELENNLQIILSRLSSEFTIRESI